MSSEQPPPEYLPVHPQMLTGIAVRDLDRSMRFYGALGFDIVQTADNTAEARWGDRLFTLNERTGLPATPDEQPVGGVRVVVTDVETY